MFYRTSNKRAVTPYAREPFDVSIVGNAYDSDIDKGVIVCNNIVSMINRAAFNGLRCLTYVRLPEYVTDIGEWAFEDCQLSLIVIGSYVTIIRKGAFEGNGIHGTDVKKITCYSDIPPTLASDNIFSGTSNCPIYVPSASVNAYKSATNWSAYADRIQAIP